MAHIPILTKIEGMDSAESHLARAFEAGRAAWPGVGLAFEPFARRMKEREVLPGDLATRGSDLYLALACAQRDPAALSYFERTFLPHVDQYVARLRLADDVIDEVRQELRIRLLAGPDPRVGHYGGRGPLGGWVRVAAVRIALSWIDDNRSRRLNDSGALSAIVADGPSPEVAALKGRYSGAFQAALDRSIALLDPRDRTVLRLHFVDRLNIDAIGTIYRVHRATVARWLVDIRKRIFASLRDELSLDLKATSSEFRSMLSVVKEDLNLSMQRVLGSRGG